MTDANARVKAVLEKIIQEGREVGLQVAAYLDGELVIDTWAGLADEATGRPVDGDTLFTVFSTTKGITATCIHMLADRGKLDYDDPIVKYWPEFGKHGKDKATIRHGLTHRIGIPQMPDGSTPELMCDWDAMCQALADMEPVWEPGTKTGYHAYTYGWILGEVVRRVDGRSIAQFVQDDICRPLGIDSLFLGIPDEVEPRVATLRNAPPLPNAPTPPPDSLIRRAIPLSVGTTGEVFNRPDVRRASIPGAGGIMNARSLARHYAALACGGELNGVRLLSPERIKIATELQIEDTDEVIGQPVRKGLGYFLSGPISPMGPRLNAFGHPGAGGSIGFADPDKRFAFGLTKTLLTVAASPDENTAYVVANAAREALGID